MNRPPGDRPPMNSPPGDRPPMNRPPGDRPPMNRPPGDRPPMNRPPGDRPPMNRPPGDRPPMNRPPGDRPPMNRPPGDRPPMNRPSGDRPPMNRPSGDRPPMNRPPGDRPPMNRPYGDRPPMNRPPGDRPPMNRPSGDRPPMNRPPGDRPPMNRPGGGGTDARPADAKTWQDKKKAVAKKPGAPGESFDRKGKGFKGDNDSRNNDFRGRGRRTKRGSDPKRQPDTVMPKKIIVGETQTVQELASKLGKTIGEIIKRLMELGIMVTINQELDVDTIGILAAEYGVEVEVKIEKSLTELEDPEDDPEMVVERPPVVTVMGHVDHGKTSLLDAIRETNVIATEAGGITQHIGAYQVEIRGRRITFLDTPGHEAFTAMRARGAKATDIAVLVVAADDGVMPQTIEALNHAKAANVPVIVAVNKIDKVDANPDRVKQQLTEYGLLSEEWGGETIFVDVSALRRENIDQLLEMILLVAEVGELKANPNRPALGIVIEAELDKGRGPVATMLVQKGTLNIGDSLVAGHTYGKVRAMIDDKGQRVKKAGPSMPVEVQGLSDVPQAGDVFQVVEIDKLARLVASRRGVEKREEELQGLSRVSLDDLSKLMDSGQVKDLNVIIKGDVRGSVEALKQALVKLNTEEVKVNIIHGGVGSITETDVMLAATSQAVIIGFNVRPDAITRKAAENERVDIHLYQVIYEAIDDIKAAMSGLLDPEYKEIILGRAQVRATFKVPKAGSIAGSYVTEGKLTSRAQIRVIRDGVVIFQGKIDSLKRFKDDVREVAQGYECGIGVENFNDIKENDIIEAFEMKEIKRELQ
ncbi:MAG: translation initiation factor IF-2 [Bacillota bacterium]